MIISIPALTSGAFEDTAHSDSVAVGDLLDYGIVALETGTGHFTMDWIGAHFLATDTTLCMIGGTPTDSSTETVAHGHTAYSSLFGAGNLGDDLTRSTGLFPYALTASKFTNFLTAAGLHGAATFTLLKNGSASALSVSSTEHTAGYFTDNTDTVTFAVGDTCANQIVGTGQMGYSVTWAGAALLLDS
jgi:hypothetical protein